MSILSSQSKFAEYKIGDTDSFKILIFNINDLGFEKIISNASYKIEEQEVFTVEELVELALTSLIPGTREGNVKQFYELSFSQIGFHGFLNLRNHPF